MDANRFTRCGSRGGRLLRLLFKVARCQAVKGQKRKPCAPAAFMLFSLVVVLSLVFTPAGFSGGAQVELVPGTAVLLTQSGGGGGNGGNATSTSSSTNIFSPAAYVDYKRFGGEPSVAVDRYPFPVPTGANVDLKKECPGGVVGDKCYKDIVYQSAPQGVAYPRYSQFWKSDDLGQTFRKSQQFPIHGLEQTNAGGGGGDSHQAIGELTHFVYFVDLPLDRITLNVSEDLGETWRSDPFGSGLAFLDDRQWVEADETALPDGRVYISTINLLNLVTPTLSAFINTTGAPPGGFAASPCNPATFAVGAPATAQAPASGETPCPDPADQFLWTAGPVVADNEGTATRPPTHHVYIPFIRRIASDPLGTGVFGIDEWQLWVAKSVNRGATWTRHLVAIRPPGNNPANIFPQLTIDRGGNLYFNWSETQGGTTQSTQGTTRKQPEQKLSTREQDIFYTFSTNGGAAWAPPINLTPERGDSAVFPWMVAGDPGQVDLVYYKANTGLNSNIAFFDANGEECDPAATQGCRPNPSVWNVFFAQSQNALNTGSNFKSVQVSTQPNHIGQICTSGLACEGDRDLLDFFTVDIDHRGAAHIAFSDDNQRRNTDTRDRMTRQIAGNSVFKDQTITLQNEWPVRDHAVIDRAGDVVNTASVPIGSCPGMDVLKTAVDRRDGLITVTMTLNGPPTAAGATACGGVASSGGIWGTEFWAASTGDTGPSNNFYVAYRDDAASGPRVEGGTVDNANITLTSLEFFPRTVGTLGGTCFPTDGSQPPAPCTITMTVSAASLGITPGNGLYSITGLSAYFFGATDRAPATRLILGNSEQADVTAAFHYLGSGTP